MMGVITKWETKGDGEKTYPNEYPRGGGGRASSVCTG